MTEQTTIQVFVSGDGELDRACTETARAFVERVLRRLEGECGDRRPQVQEIAQALGVHYRRAPRILAALGLRGRVRERATL